MSNNSPGTLYLYKEEFHLYATHSPLTRAQHKYTHDANTSEWNIRSSKCLQEVDFEEGVARPCCSECASLGMPTSIQRQVVRFVAKYNAACLLSARLFGNAEDVKNLLEKVNQSYFGQNNSTFWKSITNLSCHALQNWVRKSFHMMPDDTCTDALHRFRATVVVPCMKVNVAAIPDGVAKLSAQFVNAIESKTLDEMDSVRVLIAEASVSGKLDQHPFLQGLILQCARKIDKDSRGVGMEGRKKSCSESEHRLIENAAFSFAMSGHNHELAVQLGQNLRPPKMFADDTPKFGLPNPVLALKKGNEEQLRENLELIDQKFARSSEMSTRRCILALDHTYLSRGLQQTKVKNEAGLVGSPWSPLQESREFMPFAKLPPQASRSDKAPLMLECLIWNPCGVKQSCFSVASMPMSLSAHQVEKNARDHGKRVPGQD